MPSRVITAMSTAGTNVEKKKGEFVSFDSITSDTGPVSNAIATSATLYISNYQTYMPNGWLNVIFGNNSGTIVANTQLLAQNSTSHSSTETLDNLNSDVLLTATVTQMRLGVQGNGSSTASYVNIRNGCTITLTINYEYNTTACMPPTSVAVNATNVAPGAEVTLSWSGAQAGTNNAITGYHIYRGTSVSGDYTHVYSVSTNATSGSCTVTAPSTSGSSYYYKIGTIGSVSGYNSGLSSAYATLTCIVTAPAAPTTAGVNATNVAPGTAVTLSWSGASAGTNNAIVGYHIYRWRVSQSGPVSEFAHGITTSATSGSITVTAPEAMGKVYEYQVYTLGSTGLNSGPSPTCTLTTATTAFTDPTLTSQVTPIKAAHMTELQQRVNGLRNYYGLTAYAFTPIAAGQTSLGAWNTHVRQIREAFDALGISHATWIDVSVNCPTAAVMKQLRDIVMEGKLIVDESGLTVDAYGNATSSAFAVDEAGNASIDGLAVDAYGNAIIKGGVKQ